MAEDFEQKIKLTYETNADETAKDVDSLASSVENVGKKQKETTKATEKADETNKKTSGGIKEQTAALEGLSGGIGGAISGMKAMLKQMWLIIANPLVLTVVAIVGALALLFKAFTSTNDGADKMEQMMAGVSATIDILRDRFLKIAGAIVKFMTGDFKGAMADGKAAVSGFGDEVAAEFKKAANATKALQEVEDAMRGLGESRAKLNRDLSATKEIITDENASFAEKKKAIDEVRKAEEAQTAGELANAKKKLKAIQDLNALSDTSDEDLKKESDAKIALYNLEEQSANNRRAINKAEDKAKTEELARIKSISDARAAAEKTRLEKIAEIKKAKKDLLDLEYSEEEKVLRKIQDLNDKTEEEKLARQKERDLADIERLKQKGVDTRDLLIYNAELYATLEQELADKRAEEEQARKDAQKVKDDEAAAKAAADQEAIDQAMLQQAQDIQTAKFKIAEDGIRLIASIFGKSKAIQKAAIIAENALAIGKMWIANNLANIGALATPQAIASSGASAIPVIAVNNVSTGIGIASSIAATAKALQAVGGGSAGSSSGQAVSPRAAASATPQVGFQTSSENQIATSIAETKQQTPVVEAFIVESSITTAQELSRKKIVGNSI